MITKEVNKMIWEIREGKDIISYSPTGDTYSEQRSKIINIMEDFLEENIGLPAYLFQPIIDDAVKLELHRQFWLQYLSLIREKSFIVRIKSEDSDEQALDKLRQRFQEVYIEAWYNHQGIYSIVKDDLIAGLATNKTSVNTNLTNVNGATSTIIKNNDTPQSGDNSELTKDTYLSSSSRTSSEEVTNTQTGDAVSNYTITEDVTNLLAENKKLRDELSNIYDYIRSQMGIEEVE